MVRSRAGQALVEFALVAPIVLLIIGATVDLGRGMLLYGLLTGASRDTARQARNARIAGGADDLAHVTFGRQFPDERVLASPAPDDEHSGRAHVIL